MTQKRVPSAARSLRGSKKRSEPWPEVALVADPASSVCSLSLDVAWQLVELLAGVAGCGLTWDPKNKAFLYETDKQTNRTPSKVPKSALHTCSESSDRLGL